MFLIKFLLYFTIFIFVFYFYIYNRISGCKNKNAINYNKNSIINNEIKCEYNILGCMDKNSGNFNLYANTSCEEDCINCKIKGTCDLCYRQEKCKDKCPSCICKPKKYGCNRIWNNNYDDKVTNDNNTCISNILNNIFIVSGGDCDNCSSSCIIKIGNEYPVFGGSKGINLLVMENDNNYKIKYNKSFMTGNYLDENIKFVNFIRKYVYYNDIVIIVIREDAVGKKKELNNNNEYTNFLPILTEDSKKILQQLGAKYPDIPRNGSYILIGNFLNNIYYETYSYNSDCYFPYFNLKSYGCINLDNPIFTKEELDISKLKLISMSGDYKDISILNSQSNDKRIYKNIDYSKFIDMNRVDNIYRCALEVLSLGYNIFSLSKSKCYVYKSNNIKTYLDNKEFIYLNEENKFFKISDNICNLNNKLLPYGNNDDESIFYIEDIYYSGLFSMLFNGRKVELYSLKDFTGSKHYMGLGENLVSGIIPLTSNSIEKFIKIPITSIKIPTDFVVTLYREILDNEDHEKFNKYEIEYEEDYLNFINLDLTCCEGCEISVRYTTSNKQAYKVGYTRYDNLIKKLKFYRNETSALLYLYDNSTDSNTNNNYILFKEYDLESYDDINEIKNNKFTNKKGYIQILDYNKITVRTLEFNIWSIFWNDNFSLILNQWKSYYLNFKFKPNYGIFIVNVVNPNKKILPEVCVLEGYDKNSNEVNNGYYYKEFENITKNGPYTNDEINNNNITENPYTSNIYKIVVQQKNSSIIFYEDKNLSGKNIILSYGNYNLPDDLCFIIKSIKINLIYCVIKLYLEFNFENEYIRFINYGSNDIKKDILIYNELSLYLPLKKIKSISIQKISYNTIISNNSYPENYNSLQKYNSLEYPITFKLSNKLINNLNYNYNYFKDNILIKNHEKQILEIKESFNSNFLKNIDIIEKKIINSGGGINYIFNKIKSNNNFYDKKTDSIKKYTDNICCFKTYDNNNNIIRKILVYNNNYINYNKINNINELFNSEIIIDNQSNNVNINNYKFKIINSKGNFTQRIPDFFSKNIENNSIVFKNNKWKISIISNIIKQKELQETIINEVNDYLFSHNYIIKISYENNVVKFKNIDHTKIEFINLDKLYFENYEHKIIFSILDENDIQEYNKYFNIYLKLDNYFNKYGKLLLIKNTNNSFNIINYNDISIDILKNNIVNIYLYDMINETIIEENINNSESNNLFNVYILKKNLKIQKPEFCVCEKTYDLKDIIPYIINILNFNRVLNEFFLSENILNFKNVLKDNNKLNNTNLIYYLYDDLSNVTNKIYFNGDKFCLNENVNNLNTLDDFDIDISRQEKKLKILTKNEFSLNNKYDTFILNFNKKIKFNDIINSNFNLNCINLVNKLLLNKGILITYDLNNIIIRKKIFNNFYIEDIGNINDVRNIVFYSNELFFEILNELNEKKLKIPLNFLNSLDRINYYLKNKDCNIKIYDINYKIINNIKLIKFNKNKYFDLDDFYISVNFSYNNKIIEFLYIEIDINPFYKIENYNNLINLCNINNINIDKILENKETIFYFFDKNNKITKSINLSNNNNNKIVLFNNPIKYIEIYKSNLKYIFYYNDKIIFTIFIPKMIRKNYFKMGNNKIFINKITCNENYKIKIFDDNNYVINIDDDIIDDDNIYNFMSNIIFGNYIGKFIIEFYPKINKLIIRLINQKKIINKVEEINGNYKYLFENSYYNLIVSNKNSSKYYFNSKGIF